jgi:hypothetical protein
VGWGGTSENCGNTKRKTHIDRTCAKERDIYYYYYYYWTLAGKVCCELALSLHCSLIGSSMGD